MQQDLNTTTSQQYDVVIKECKDIFAKKTHDYGTAWRVLRTISIVDQIYIKALGISPEEALNGTTVLNTIALLNGATILRVHDVKEAVQAIQLIKEYKK